MLYLISLSKLIPDAIIDMRYATERNVSGKVLSTENTPRLTQPAAEALVKVAQLLRNEGLHLVIWDAFRSEQVQEKLRQYVNDDRYASKNSKHCKGLALDVSLANKDRLLLDMGTDHDDFSSRAHINASGLTDEQQYNRRLLKKYMEQDSLFRQWPYEWWHFDFIQ